MRPRSVRVVLLGTGKGRLASLLQEALTEGRPPCELVPPDPGRADIVLAVVRRDDAPEVIAAARAIAQRVPVIALLPECDEDLALQVLQRGAQAWCPLDGPKDLLRSMVIVLTGRDEPAGGQTN